MRNTKQYRNANFQNSKQKPHDTTISRNISISPGIPTASPFCKRGLRGIFSNIARIY